MHSKKIQEKERIEVAISLLFPKEEGQEN